MAQMSSEKITLEDVVFRYMLDLSQSAAKIRTSMDLDYQKNADNYYFQVMTLWSILGDYIDEDVKEKRVDLLVRAEKRYNQIIKDKADKPAILKARKDQVVSLTFSVASKTLAMMSECLSKKGILRERSAQAVAGEQQLEEVKDLAENSGEEDGMIAGPPTDVAPTYTGAEQ
jgi:hypothetical protein